MTKSCLVLVDIQYDFLPGGALAVTEGDRILPVVLDLLPRFDLVVATQDWHPGDHGSFASNQPGHRPFEVIRWNGIDQVLWPDHCVQGTRGAELVAELEGARIDAVFRKGEDPSVDSYSGFFDNGRRRATGLAGYLRERAVDRVVVVGLATDYCVKFTALDARTDGFAAYLVEDGCRGVELKPGDSERAVEEMRAAGVVVLDAGSIGA